MVQEGKPLLDPTVEALFQSLPEGADDESGYMAAKRMFEQANAKRNAKIQAGAKDKAEEDALSTNAKRTFDESAETDEGGGTSQNEDGYGPTSSFERVQWADDLPSIDEIPPMPHTALPSKDAPPEAWESFRAMYEANLAKSEAQFANVKSTVGKLQRMEREGGYMCVKKKAPKK